MTSIRFLISKLSSANYGEFIKTAKRISKIQNKSWISVLVDIIKCTRKYGSGHVDYQAFKMYEMSHEERAKILTIGKNNLLVRTLNDPVDRMIFEDKVAFNEKFDKYLKRDWMSIDGKNYDRFEEICHANESVMVKPLDESCGNGIEKIYPSKEKDLKETYDRLFKQKKFLVEETVIQCDEMNKLCTTSINTIRLVTILSQKTGEVNVVAGAIRMGRNGSFVDNFNHGGISTVLNVETGVTVTEGFDKLNNSYDEVPELGTKLKGFKVPRWGECIDLVCEAAKVLSTVRYVAWDVAISKDQGPLLIEGNSYPGQDLMQYPKLNLGTYDYFKKFID